MYSLVIFKNKKHLRVLYTSKNLSTINKQFIKKMSKSEGVKFPQNLGIKDNKLVNINYTLNIVDNVTKEIIKSKPYSKEQKFFFIEYKKYVTIKDILKIIKRLSSRRDVTSLRKHTNKIILYDDTNYYSFKAKNIEECNTLYYYLSIDDRYTNILFLGDIDYLSYVDYNSKTNNKNYKTSTAIKQN